MIVLVQANVLTAGLISRNEVLRGLPIRVVAMQTGGEAAGCLRNETVDSVISKWELDDMKDGWFLRRFKAIKPRVPTIAFVKAGDIEQEIKARSLGVSAVLTDESSDELLRQTIINILGLTEPTSVKAISPAGKKQRRSRKERIRR